MKIFVTLMVLLLLVAAAFFLRPAPDADRALQNIQGLPWQIEVHDDGTATVFGLTLDKTTIGEARERLGGDMELGLIAARKEAGALEMYYGHFTAGVLTGKLVLVGALSDAALAQLRERAMRVRYRESGAKQYVPHPDDLPIVDKAVIESITFLPSVNFDEETVIKRFGLPQERVAQGDAGEHFLYPVKGLDLLLNSDGKEVLQYVAPARFERLRSPLVSP